MDLDEAIWLIEDDEIDILTIKRAFRDLKIMNPLEVWVDSEEALARLLDWAPLPKLILLDLNMPRLGGLEFLAYLKVNKRLSVVPVIILSTSDQEEDEEEAIGLSAADYIVKPLDYDEFLDILRDIHQTWIVPD